MLIAFAGAFLYSASLKVPTNAASLCRTDVPPKTVIALIIDTTDALSVAEKMQIENEIERLRGELPVFGLLELYAVNGDPTDDFDPRITLCNPGRGEDMNAIYQNPKMAEQKWLREFKSKLDGALASSMSAETADRSPIMESIRAISISALGKPQLDGAEKKLALFSDLLQHTDGTSHYRRPLSSFEEFRATNQYAAVKPNLAGVEVQIYYIVRPSTTKLQNREHIEFWAAFLEASGATVKSIKRMLGG